MRRSSSLAGNLRDNFDTGIQQSATLLGVVCQEANSANAKVTQDCRRQAKIPAIGLESQGVVGFDRVDADVLQLKGVPICVLA